MMNREISHIIPGVLTSDGAGVRLRRSLGGQDRQRLDPFLMLDDFSSNDTNDYIAGFPMHPHRGFETVTYMLEGHMLHQDHLGNRGHLKTGGVQWMTAGRGIIHSEMPQQESGAMRGFQLWINLPAREKMKPAGYLDIQEDAIPRIDLFGGGALKVIAGEYLDSKGRGIRGPIDGLSTEPIFFDIHLNPNESFTQPIPSSHNAFVYLYEGGLLIGSATEEVPKQSAIILSEGNQLQMIASEQGAKAIVLAAKPLYEPIVQHGPFVMNTHEEIEQAIDDFQNNRLTAA